MLVDEDRESQTEYDGYADIQAREHPEVTQRDVPVLLGEQTMVAGRACPFVRRHHHRRREREIDREHDVAVDTDQHEENAGTEQQLGQDAGSHGWSSVWPGGAQGPPGDLHDNYLVVASLLLECRGQRSHCLLVVELAVEVAAVPPTKSGASRRPGWRGTSALSQPRRRLFCLCPLPSCRPSAGIL